MLKEDALLLPFIWFRMRENRTQDCVYNLTRSEFALEKRSICSVSLKSQKTQYPSEHA